MSTLTDTVTAVAELAKTRDEALRTLDKEYNEASKVVCKDVDDANQACRDLDRAYQLTRKAIREDYRDGVAEVTGTDPQEQDNSW